MSDDWFLQAIEGMRIELRVAAIALAGLTDMVVSRESDVGSLQEDMRKIRRDVSELWSAMTRHLNWHLGQAS